MVRGGLWAGGVGEGISCAGFKSLTFCELLVPLESHVHQGVESSRVLQLSINLPFGHH